MKKILILFILSLSACTSFQPKPEELRQTNKCMVWKEGLLGQRFVAEVEGELAKQKQTCWILDMFACTYTDYTYKDPKSSEIQSSLPPADKTIAKLEGNKLSVDMTGIKVEPFELKKGKADYKLKGPFGPEQVMSVEYNESCSTRQAALGLLTIIAR